MPSAPSSPAREALFVCAHPASPVLTLSSRAPSGSAWVLEKVQLDEQAPWSAFQALRAGRTVVVADAELLAAALAPHGAGPEDRDAWIGLAELAAVIAPGPLATGRLDVLADLAHSGPAISDPGGGSPVRIDDSGHAPRDVQATARALVRRFLAGGPAAVELAAFCWQRIARGFDESEPATARWLERVFELVDELARVDGSEPPFAACAAARGFEDGLDDYTEELLPRWTRELVELGARDPLPPRVSDPTPFDALDHATLERVFQTEIPGLFGEDPTRSYRPGQHEVAAGIAENLERGELFTAHAPTGTGKTLAYLIPALLWSWRHAVRVGVSTYTRALQEQALDNDLPLARRALSRAGSPAAGARVALLKGRDNYLCWRALTLQSPASADDPETWFAWTYVALFALADESGDLDRLPRRLACPALTTRRISDELETLVRQVRAASGCCQSTRDRSTCASEVARARAERSHVVITNHSFALARPEFFRNLVFDECEHLPDQAASAWSHAFGLRDAHRRLKRARDPSRPTSRAPLDALQRVLPPSGASAAGEELQLALAAHDEAGRQLEVLLREVRAFLRWRGEAARTIHAREEHALLRRYVEQGPAEALLIAHAALAAAFNDLEVATSGLLEELEGLALSGVPRWSRALQLFRADLAELIENLNAWIPLVDGRPVFDATRLHDVEEDGRGERLLVARVLAPGEHLGRHYYPDLQSAAFVSATTWLQGGFGAALGYLGLERAAEPAPDEDRDPRSVRLLRAPSPFDYGRVLVCVPSDAPRYERHNQDFHVYVRRFLAHLCERTRGRCLALFTNSEDVKRTGAELAGSFRVRGLPLWYQGMPGLSKEDLSLRFRSSTESTLLGVDTFWYGADFPGETLEYLVIVRLPYGVPDRYHHAQCALYGSSNQRKKVYLPRALAKFRQGFGRLMRKETDRGVVFVLDQRILSGAHKVFLGELPLATDEYRTLDPNGEDEWESGGARLVRDTTDECLAAAFEHTGIHDQIEARGLASPFWEAFEELPAPPASPEPTPQRSRPPSPAARGPNPPARPAHPGPEPRAGSAAWSDADELPF